MTAPEIQVVVAFLGPRGTYTHQAAHSRFKSSVSYVAKDTIADAFDALSPEIPFAVVPKENSIFGSVVETYDLLRSINVGKTIFVREEITLQVQHCLLVRRGVRLQDVTRVLSHEQALGQCGQFLNENLPNAKTIKTPSTAYAAEALFEEEYRSNSAAICSKICATLFEDLNVLCEGVQNEKSNFTKFWVLTTSLNARLPEEHSSVDREDTGHVIFRFSALSDSSDLISALTSLGELITRIDRRPNPGDTPFRDIYFVEVTRKSEDRLLTRDYYKDLEKNGSSRWTDAIQTAVHNIDRQQWEVCLIGMW